MPEGFEETCLPRLAPHARLQYDGTRARWVLLLPERVLLPDDVTVDVLKRCDGTASLAGIVTALANEYDADRALIARDVNALLMALQAAGAVRT